MGKTSGRESDQEKGGKLTVLLLGTPEVLMDGLPLKVDRRKSRALLYYLAAHRNPVLKEALPAIFWPDLEICSARHALSVTLHGLRKNLGELLLSEKNCLALSTEVKVDVRLYEESLAPRAADLDHLTELLTRNRGDFLEGFELPDSPLFSVWQTIERERYRRLTINGLACQAERFAQAGNYRAAIEALDRALIMDPLQEELQGLGMRFHYLAGDRMGAIRRYHKLCRLLSDEAGVSPMPQIQDLYRKIISDAPLGPHQSSFANVAQAQPAFSIPSPAPPDQLPFVGRRTELQAIREIVQTRGKRFILLEGEPGIGKTRLAAEYVRQFDGLTIQGAAYEPERVLPYQPLVEAFGKLLLQPDWFDRSASVQSVPAAAWRAEMKRLIAEMNHAFTGLQDNGSNEDKYRLWETVNRFLGALSRRQPVLVFLDDLQWADASTLGLLNYLIRQAEDAPVVFIGAGHSFAPDSDMAGLVQRLARSGQLARLRLTPLDSADIKELGGRLSSVHGRTLAEYLQRNSEGNPYLLTESVRHMRESGLLSPRGELETDKLPETLPFSNPVLSFIQARLAPLSRSARHVIDVAAVAGGEFEFEIVMKAVALPEDAALDGLDELRAAGLIRVGNNGTGYRFDYSLTREVVYQCLEGSRRRWFHHRVTEALENTHPSAFSGGGQLLQQC